MKIMKVVYSAKCHNSEWSSASEMYEEQDYMGEQDWAVGEKFNGEFIQGKVTEIYRRQNGDVMVEVDGWVAMTIPPHAVQRIYFGEE